MAIIIIIGREVLLSCPNFSEEFIIHIETSKTQLGGVTSHQRKPIYCLLLTKTNPRTNKLYYYGT